LTGKSITEDMLCTYLEAENIEKIKKDDYMKALQAVNAAKNKV